MQYSTAIENIENRLLGLEAPTLVFDERFQTQVAIEIQTPLNALADAASSAGFDLQIASHYRSFDRQLIIWNEKANGARPVLDAQGRAIAIHELSDQEKVFAILKWSSLPGASRHHWGTEVDIFDASRLPEGYRVQLTREETIGEGVFAEFHAWLSRYLDKENHQFFRPYQGSKGLVAEEPWHLSYAPIAQYFASIFTQSHLTKQIESVDIELKSHILANMDFVFENYVRPYQ